MAWYYNPATGTYFEGGKDFGELIMGDADVMIADQPMNPSGGITEILNEIQKLQARVAVLEKELANQ